MTKLAILSNINLDPLKHDLGQDPEYTLYFAGYNQWQTELLNPGSGLHDFHPDYIFLYLDAGEFQPEIQSLFLSIETYMERQPGAIFLVSNFMFPPCSVNTYADKGRYLAGEWNAGLDEFAGRHDNVFVFDFNRIINLYGYSALFEDKFWYLGRIKHSARGFRALSAEFRNVMACLKGKARKVLVLDLDGTLWGGVVGEEGWENLKISQEGTGRIFLDLQKKIKQLQQTGVLLAICSKNNEEDAREVFEKNPSMLLTWDDFIVHKINWDPKSENVIGIAESLNLGLDSMVMLDDSKVEREMMKKTLPGVVVPDFPEDISLLNRWFVTDVVYPWFSKQKLSSEDLEKTRQYKRNIDREKIRKKVDYQEFLAQLQIRLSYPEPTDALCFRIAQLTQKTNQFNLTVKRYTEPEIKAMMGNPSYRIFACEYEDKFGKEGLIGCALAEVREDHAVIDTFLLSCRVLGRNVETLFLEHLFRELKQQGVRILEGSYTEAPRNALVKDFYPRHGFTSEGDHKFIMNLENV